MYAIFENGSHQYRVSPGDTITIDRQSGDHGAELIFDQVLLIAGGDGTQIGAPLLTGAKVVAKVTRQFRDKKIIIQKFRRRKNMRRRRGHRQYLTTIRITDIVAG
jgi:large subunit ribosomal protein L21